jgi:hypothetical protein
MSTAMMAITTSSSINVKPERCARMTTPPKNASNGGGRPESTSRPTDPWAGGTRESPKCESYMWRACGVK